jgi:hypothetical protein
MRSATSQWFCLNNKWVTGRPMPCGLRTSPTTGVERRVSCPHSMRMTPILEVHGRTHLTAFAMRHRPHTSIESLPDQRAGVGNTCRHGAPRPPLAGGPMGTCGNPGLTCNGLDAWQHWMAHVEVQDHSMGAGPGYSCRATLPTRSVVTLARWPVASSNGPRL